MIEINVQDLIDGAVGTLELTNDAQLKRAANDFLAFAEKTSPHDDDLLLIEDSQASGAKKRLKIHNLPGGPGGVNWGEIGGTLSEQGDLDIALDGKSPIGHGHAETDITNLVNDLAGKAPTSHGHAEADVTGLVNDLAGKSAVGHGHAQADVTGLVDALAAKALASDLSAHTGAAAPHSGHIAHSLATAVNDFLVASGAGAFVKKTLAEVKTILGLGTAAYTAATDYVTHALATAANDFLVASGSGVFVKKTLAEVKTILGLGSAAYTASTDYAPAAHNQDASTINAGTLDGDRLPAISATKKGGVPLTGTPSGKFLKDDGTWASAGGGTPSESVVSETSFGQSPAAGTSANYSKGDHTHGTPTDPVPAHASLATGIHGVGTSTVESASGSQAKVDAHKTITASVHNFDASGNAPAQTHDNAKHSAAYALDSALSAHAGAASPHSGHEATANKGGVSGYAGLDAAQKVPPANLGGAGAGAGNYLCGDQTWKTPPGASEVAMSNRMPAGDITIPANYSAVVVGDYEIASGFVLDLQSNSVMEIS